MKLIEKLKQFNPILDYAPTTMEDKEREYHNEKALASMKLNDKELDLIYSAQVNQPQDQVYVEVDDLSKLWVTEVAGGYELRLYYSPAYELLDYGFFDCLGSLIEKIKDVLENEVDESLCILTKR